MAQIMQCQRLPRLARFRPVRSVLAKAGDVPGESPETQEALVDLLRMKISESKAVEKLGGVADAEKMKLIEQADNVRSSVDTLPGLSQAALAIG